MRAARFSSTRTPSTLTSVSNRIYLHDTRRALQDQVVEGEQGWVLQGVLARAPFRRAAVSGQKFSTVLSLHISNIFAKKKVLPRKSSRPFVLMISQNIDLVAGDFNGTAWRCCSCDKIITIDEAFADCAVRTPRCGDPDPSRTTGPTSVVLNSSPAFSASTK